MTTQKVDVLLQRNAELEKELAAKNRALDIEAAMERVRSRALVMQQPAELVEIAHLLRNEMALLGVEELEGSSISVHNEATGKTDMWYAIKDDKRKHKFVADHIDMDLNETWVGRQMLQFYRSGRRQISIPMRGAHRKEWIDYCATHSEYSSSLGSFYEETMPDRTYHLYRFSSGFVGAASPGNISAESWNLLQRATAVFSMAYTRFLDLQKAEAQAREAKIEAALERVRTVAMSMRKPDDLLTVCEVVYKELYHLGFDELRNAMLNIYNDAEEELLNYDYSADAGAKLNRVPYHSHPIVRNYIIEAKQAGETLTQLVIEGEELEDWKKFREMHGEHTSPKLKAASALYYYHYSFEAGVMSISNFKPINAAQLGILKRFRNVFNLSYQRYIDITTAEAQAREAKIEAALERVRAKAMAMHNSNDLTTTAGLVFTELRKLGIDPIRCGVSLQTKESRKNELYYAIPTAGGDDLSFAGSALLSGHPVLSAIYDHWIQGKDYFPSLSGESLLQYYQTLKQVGFDVPVSSTGHEQHGYYLVFSEGMFYGWAETPFQEAQIILLKRFAAVIDLTFRRYTELKRAEEQALRAQQDLIEIKAARKKAEDAFNQLKATQQQLIQKEKMASLGELTAGIAHEIQNPLNFVNNFSAVNKELLQEVREEIEKGNLSEVIAIVGDLEANEEKIILHGKRADAIVKGMLQHSRGSVGDKQPTDINSLVGEHMRLAYHGYRAREKSFAADVITSYDPLVGWVNVVPQDIGRVLLNLFNNAFYAVQQMKMQLNGSFEPTVTVSTERKGEHVVVTVKDNGTGMPQQVAEKVFQPFFTTKPTGEGTGLGLSLSYDIITKGHGGNLSVRSTQGEGSEFVVQLPA